MKKTLYSCAIAAIFLSWSITSAEETKQKVLDGIEFFSGFSRGSLCEKGHLSLIPFLVDFNFDLSTNRLLQFQIEPFISPVIEPDPNVELGTSFLFKLGLLPQTAKFQPYLKTGAGLLYMTQHTREQGTQFNFIEYAGAGIHYFCNKKTALTLEGRFRHLSNASTKKPNKGIDTWLALLGITYRF